MNFVYSSQRPLTEVQSKGRIKNHMVQPPCGEWACLKSCDHRTLSAVASLLAGLSRPGRSVKFFLPDKDRYIGHPGWGWA
ncbi:hypothetical protein CEXT_620031 [Caerostris extrusa]|uniref:Uncharacterized protein n=1 Tax=Caerostris extrusa TaxID=172846 RepID=A0AAV4SB26_CAEEX|nr:hypothetical protein CEXT_620031 [Caerostris extrusa]